MELKLDLSKTYGIVLEGGGARGAYQIGAWKALREAGVQIKGVAGTSVGALNGALICMDDLERAEYIWENISYSTVMDVDDDVMKSLLKWDMKALDFQGMYNDLKRLVKDGGFDITPLRQLIEEIISEDRIRNSERELFVTTYSVTDRKLQTTDVKTFPEGSIGDMLLASAYLPVFKSELLGGKKYIDAGGFNNVPVDVLLDHGYENMIVIRIYGLGFDSEKVTEIPEHVKVIHIAPRQDLGHILEFDKKRSRKNMVLGYYDAKRVLYGLSGKRYYIDAPRTEAYYFDRMMSDTLILHIYSLPEEEETGYRYYTETLFPRLAKQFKLREGWDYKDIYLAILEDQAKQFRINRFRVYSVDDLQSRIVTRLQK